MANPEELRLALKLVEEAAEFGPEDPFDGELLDQPPLRLGWEQASWVTIARLPEGFCLTAGCLAGHVAIQDGFTEVIGSESVGTAQWLRNPVTNQVLAFDSNDGNESVAEYAQRKLDLTNKQADGLFHADNSLDDLRLMVEDLCEDPAVTQLDV